MKNIHLTLSFLIACSSVIFGQNGAWVRINQLGYLPEDVKVAVFLSEKGKQGTAFLIKDAVTGKAVIKGTGKQGNAARWGMNSALRLDFSLLKTEGKYYVECNGAKSPVFAVNNNVYDGAADFVLNYMRQQRCGYNPFLDAECHQHDGYIVDHPTLEGRYIDVRGGWHDASDYLQYLTTSATATFQMLFAWQQTPDKSIFGDKYDASGRKGANGIPDILDEARWGLEWMLRMNPDSALMFNQIADDRDHANFRSPAADKVDYGWGPGTGRPVYPITGKPQGLSIYKNRSTGVSSSAAKYASAFAMGADIFKTIDSDFSNKMEKKVLPAYHWSEAIPGNNQTVCTVSPYFYEEDNWVDDMELAAATQYNLSKNNIWLKKADYWGQLEEVSPWIELNRARHYQFYPFINLGHFYLGSSDDENISKKYQGYMKKGLDFLKKRAENYDDPFLNGVPFLWCSSNFVSAAVTQAMLYCELTGDTSFAEMEAALRDWLFGCNPWGTSMIVGLPENGDYPIFPHSSLVLEKKLPIGGLIDGPINRTIYETRLGIKLERADEYAPFQKGPAVYHDDIGDYSSNEPTMDGTAGLCYFLSRMQKKGQK
ncbi:MAG: glycoside hydrolase family 9 protein [Paludibacteraceae bacterium]